MQATGIIADHPSDHGPAGSRGFRAEHQSIFFQIGIQVIADYTQAAHVPIFLPVYFQNACEIFGYIGNYSTAYYLPGQGSTGCPGNQGQALLIGKTDQLLQVFLRLFGNGYCHRLLLINGGICGIYILHGLVVGRILVIELSGKCTAKLSNI
jgi:hypothetical protein